MKIRLFAWLLVSAAGILGPAAMADTSYAAGSYQVTACNAAPEAANHSWVWASTDVTASDHYSQYGNCPYRIGGSGGTGDQQGGLSTADTLGLASGAPPGSSAGWTFTAPKNTRIEQITYERYLGHNEDSSNYWSPALRADGIIVPGESCQDTIANGESCSVGAPPGEGAEPADVAGITAQQLSLSILCQAPTGQECITGASLHKAWAALYGATVTISDPTPPTLSAPTGVLWENGAAKGYHKGTESLSVEATDIGGGVQSLLLLVDDKPVASYAATCNYTYAQPCPSSTGLQVLALPTTSLADGAHTLTVEAVDAAGNHARATKEITVDNTSPAPPLDLSTTPVTPGSLSFVATWQPPPDQVAPLTQATYQLCPAMGGSCTQPTTAAAAGPALISAPGPGTYTLAVWLTDAAGNTSPLDAAHTAVEIPVASEEAKGGEGPSASPEQGTSGNTGDSPYGKTDGKPRQPSKLRIYGAVHHLTLSVHVRGPARGRVRVSYRAVYRRRRPVSATKMMTLKGGRLTAVFKLTPLIAAHARINFTAAIDNHRITGALNRRKRRSARHGHTASGDFARILSSACNGFLASRTC